MRATRYSLLPTIDSESPARGGREPGSERHPQGANSDPETRPFFLKPRLHPIVAGRHDLSPSRFPLLARSNGVVHVEKMDFADPDPVPLFERGPASNPLDSPGVVYIDGLPCSRACQSYMSWSDRALSARHREERETNVVVPAEAEIERVELAPRPRVARHAAPVSRTAPRAGIATSNTKTLNAKALNTKASHTRKVAAPNPAPQATGKEIPAATATVSCEKAVEKVVEGGEVPEPQIAKPRQAGTGAGSLHRRVAAGGGPQIRSEARGARSPCRRQPRLRSPRRLLRPRSLRCLLRLPLLPLRPPNNTAAGRGSDGNGRSRHGNRDGTGSGQQLGQSSSGAW